MAYKDACYCIYRGQGGESYSFRARSTTLLNPVDYWIRCWNLQLLFSIAKPLMLELCYQKGMSRQIAMTRVVWAIAILTSAATMTRIRVKKKQDSSTRMNIPWEPVDEQRLLAYKKEDKSWEWIFKKFPGRTPAVVRTRWTMVQHRVK